MAKTVAKPLGYGGYPPRPKQLLPLSNGVIDTARLPEFAKAVYEQFDAGLQEPFVGITTDGTVLPDLFPIAYSGPSTTEICQAANRYLDTLNGDQLKSSTLPIEANEWRAWINAFPPCQPHGVLLDTLDHSQRVAALALLEASLSRRGFADVRDVMRVNQAIADIIDDYRDTLKEYMYWLTIFGTPSLTEPWGWQIAGHHLDINCFALGGQIVMTPTFLGAEPRILDRGPHAGTRLFDTEIEAGLTLMSALSADQRAAAILSDSMRSEDLPEYLRHPTEGRQRATVGRDNLVLPYEGINAANLTSRQRDLLVDLIDCYVARLPGDHAEQRIQEIRLHLDATHLAWVGAIDAGQPFYYKIHSPVVLIEFDCHSGVFLANDEPEPFHVHTVVRTPNGNDYGRDLLRQHLARHHATPSRKDLPSSTYGRLP